MKKMFILLILMLILTGCNQKSTKFNNRTVDDSAFETKMLEAGEKFTIDLKPFEKKYLFNSVEFNYNASVIRINHKEELLALKLGESTVEVYLYYDGHLIVTLVLYKIIVIDYNDAKMVPIKSREALSSLYINPSGFYYLDGDIDMGKYSFYGITYFSGIFINPNKYVIKNLIINSSYTETQAGLIKKAENAYIDGLILENVKIKGTINTGDGGTDSTAALVGEAKNCHISNIHITGEISHGEMVGGIIGYSYRNTLINSSFIGKVSAGRYVGGLVGYYSPDTHIVASIKSGIIKNCYAIADISGGHLDTNTTHSLGGLVGFARGGKFVSLYYSGKITPDKPDYDLHKPIVADTADYYRLIDVYYVSDYELEDSYKKISNLVADIYKLTHEELTSGEVLKGLEDFTFIKGEYPII